jgi:zinc D-Ala-D-Ala carboxypeptidase
VINWTKYPNFTKEEFDCQETGENEMQARFMEMLQLLRKRYGKPMRITSGYRSPNHSIEKRKSKPGTHAHGIAADIYAVGPDKYRLVKLAFECGFTGVGVAANFIHLDCSRERCAIWSY